MAIDLFAGAGGFSLAAINQGLRIRGAIEVDHDACETYQQNIIEARSAETILFSEDILKLSPKRFMRTLNLKKGHLDLLMGGPPCQGFSRHRIKGQGVGDPRNQLLLRYFDFVIALQPKIFLVENVPGILWKRHEDYLKQFKKLSIQNGYKLHEPVRINARDFGVPQNRERVFILGVRCEISDKDLLWPPKATHFNPQTGVKPNWVNASHIFTKPPAHVLKDLSSIIGNKTVNNLTFGTSLKPTREDASNIHTNHTPELIKRFSQTPINGSREDIDFRLPCHSKDYKGHKDVYGRIRLAQPGPTITTGCFNPSKGRFLHPWKHHGITIRHAARFQTFPDNYIFSGGIISQGKQVGNAVPILLGEKIIQSLTSILKTN